MTRIFSSPNPDFKEVADIPTEETNYVHPVSTHKNHPIPVAFQVTSPFNRLRVLLPHTLVMHINPASFQETFNQKIERFQTRGGFQEQHWGQELTEISADGSTGAFMNIYTGLSSVVRQRTIAWDRYRDLYDLYKHNGSVYDPFGNIVLQGHIMLMYDRGTYIGSFRTFDVTETDDSPFAFKIGWTFKVEHTISTIQVTAGDSAATLQGWQGGLAPQFQAQNIPTRAEDPPATTSAQVAQQEVSQEAGDRRQSEAQQTFQEISEASQRRDQEIAAERAAEAELATRADPFNPGNL